MLPDDRAAERKRTIQSIHKEAKLNQTGRKLKPLDRKLTDSEVNVPC
jgi:hypothetical protein